MTLYVCVPLPALYVVYLNFRPFSLFTFPLNLSDPSSHLSIDCLYLTGTLSTLMAQCRHKTDDNLPSCLNDPPMPILQGFSPPNRGWPCAALHTAPQTPPAFLLIGRRYTPLCCQFIYVAHEVIDSSVVGCDRHWPPSQLHNKGARGNEHDAHRCGMHPLSEPSRPICRLRASGIPNQPHTFCKKMTLGDQRRSHC